MVQRSGKWKKLNSRQYEILTPKHDIYAVRTGKSWNVDVFNAKIKNPDRALMEEKSRSFDNLKEARNYVTSFKKRK